jgi:hypothetical protein
MKPGFVLSQPVKGTRQRFGHAASVLSHTPMLHTDVVYALDTAWGIERRTFAALIRVDQSGKLASNGILCRCTSDSRNSASEHGVKADMLTPTGRLSAHL